MVPVVRLPKSMTKADQMMATIRHKLTTQADVMQI